MWRYRDEEMPVFRVIEMQGCRTVKVIGLSRGRGLRDVLGFGVIGMLRCRDVIIFEMWGRQEVQDIEGYEIVGT